jgi:hypothetical protein
LENIGLFILDFTKKLSTYASDLAPWRTEKKQKQITIRWPIIKSAGSW